MISYMFLTTGGRRGKEFKPLKDIAQLEQENIYSKKQAVPDNWQSG
jgi:hypothetical protein